MFRAQFERKIAFALSATLGIALIVAVTSVVALHQLKRSTEVVVTEDARDAIRAEKLRNAMGQAVGSARSFLITGDEQFIARMQERWKEFDQLLAELQATSRLEASALLAEAGSLERQ